MTDEGNEADLVFLIDVDNTLSNNDQLKADLAQRIQSAVGQGPADRFWEIYEEVRRQTEVVDFPATVDEWSKEFSSDGLPEKLRAILDGIDFKAYLYPQAIDTLEYLRGFGTVVILSDGDQVFQRRKIQESGLAAAVDGNILIYVHKEQELPDVFHRYPARHYVVIDDKSRILSALEKDCPAEFTTILVLQGKYADPDQYAPKPDLIVPQIGDVRHLTLADFHAGTTPAGT